MKRRINIFPRRGKEGKSGVGGRTKHRGERAFFSLNYVALALDFIFDLSNFFRFILPGSNLKKHFLVRFK